MKALEHLLIQELTQIRAMESKLHGAYPALKNAPTQQIEGFVSELAKLDHKASRVERLLEALATREPAVA